MEIKILGTGCPNCKKLERSVTGVITEMGIKANIIKEEDIVKIMSYGILQTPGLVVNGKVVSSGRVLSPREIKEIINQYL